MITALGRWFPALAERPVRWYLAGQLVAVHGTFVLDITLNLLAWELSSSPAVLGTLNFLLYGPGLVVLPMMSWRLHRGNARWRTLAVLYGSITVALLLWGLQVCGWLTTRHGLKRCGFVGRYPLAVGMWLLTVATCGCGLTKQQLFKEKANERRAIET